ncbi:MAG: amidohydrolase [Bacteroidia bacterium]|nr:amidohydrolase [Bacteroidia bacterium]
MRYVLFAGVLGILLASCSSKKPADLILHHGVIYTVDSAFSVHEAVAIMGGKIIASGSNEEILDNFESFTEKDLNGAAVYPGFIDAHCHFLNYGLSLQRVDLKGTASFNEVIARVVEFAKTHPNGWLLGRGWDQNDWEVKEFPVNDTLNILFPDRPVFIRRIDGHAALANKKALEAGGITENTKVAGGEILKGGVLTDNAMDLVEKFIPPPGAEQLRKALLDAQSNCFAAGLTTVDDAGLMKDETDLIDAMHKNGTLKMRVYAMMSDSSVNYEHFLKTGPYKTERLNIRSFKFYGDGALGSRGACLLHPYSDLTGHHGFILRTYEHYDMYAHQLLEKGFQVNTHCIGDSANRMILDLYNHVLGGNKTARFRIEHCQVVNGSDFARFGSFGVIPSIQPTHATSDMYWAGDRLGPERVKFAYAYNDLLKSFGKVALGTDFPIENIYPLETFYAAVVRKDKKGWPEGGFQSGNALSRENALKGMTIWAAYANFEEQEKGSIETGKFADLVVLERDLMKEPEESITGIPILFTIVNGEIVYARDRK